MTLEERIAEAVANAPSADDGIACSEFIDPDDIRAIARAVVAVLPTADVSDERIASALGAYGHGAVGAGRTLLDAQAAAHAAEVTEIRRGYEHQLATVQELLREDAAEVEALRSDLQIAERKLARAREFGIGEFTVTTWAHSQATRTIEHLRETAEADRDRAVREALIQAEAAILSESFGYPRARQQEMRRAAEIVRSLIPGGTE